MTEPQDYTGPTLTEYDRCPAGGSAASACWASVQSVNKPVPRKGTTMSQDPKQTTFNALRQMRGDDLERAKAAFRGCPPSVMKQEYGQSGKTRNQIIAEYEAHVANIQAAVDWLNRQNTEKPNAKDQTAGALPDREA